MSFRQIVTVWPISQQSYVIYRCLLINSTFATFSSNKFEPVKPLLIFKGKPTTPENKLSDRQESRMEFGRDEKQQHNEKQAGKFKARSANRQYTVPQI